MIIRDTNRQNYSIISNDALRNPKLSMKAKGIFAYMMSLPDDWEIHVNELVKHFKDGKDAIYSALKELENNGYLTRNNKRDEKGEYDGVNYVLHEKRQSDNPPPHRENPQADYPHPVNPQLLNTNSNQLLTKIKGESKKSRFHPDNQKVLDWVYKYHTTTGRLKPAWGVKEIMIEKNYIEKILSQVDIDEISSTMSWGREDEFWRINFSSFKSYTNLDAARQKDLQGV